MNKDRRWDSELQEWVYPADWRTIETAPKDGRSIQATLVGGVPRTVQWQEMFGMGGWFISLDSETGAGKFYSPDPTHWMPLPEPPDA